MPHEKKKGQLHTVEGGDYNWKTITSTQYTTKKTKNMKQPPTMI